MLTCLLPLLVAALTTSFLAVRHSDAARLRLVAGVVSGLALLMLIGGGYSDDGPLLDPETHRHLPTEVGLSAAFGSIILSAVFSWAVVRLALAIAAWQPPPHLVRRPPA